MTNDKETKLLKILAFSTRPYSKSNIIEATRLATGLRMGNTKNFLAKYMDEEKLMKEYGKISGVLHYCFNFPSWKAQLLSITPDEIDDIDNAACMLTNNTSERLFAKAFWCYLHELPVDQKALAAACMYVFGPDDGLICEYAKQMMQDLSMVPFVARTSNGVLEGVLDDMESALDKQTFTAGDVERYSLLVSRLSEGSQKEVAGRLRAEIAFANDFARNLNIANAIEAAKDDNTGRYTSFYAAYKLMQQGDFDGASKLLLKHLKTTKQKLFYNVFLDFYYMLALTHSKAPSAINRCKTLYKDEFCLPGSAELMLAVEYGHVNPKDVSWDTYFYSATSALDKVLVVLLFRYYGVKNFPEGEEEVYQCMLESKDIRLLQLELSTSTERYQPVAEQLTATTDFHPSLPHRGLLEDWDLVLNDILQLNGSTATAKKGTVSKTVSQERIVYELNPHSLNIQPRLQKSRDGVNWTGGRNVSLEKFSKCTADGMSDEDRRIASYVECYSYGWYGQVSYELRGGKAVAALIGHPNVYDAATGQHLDVVEEKPAITVKQKNDRYTVTSDINPEEAKNGIFVTLESAQKVKVVKMSDKMKKTLTLLKQTSFPAKAKEKLTKVLELVSADAVVMSDLLKSSENIANKHTHPETVVQLQPQGTDIHCRLFTRPFGSVPPLCKPGKGAQVITTSMNGKQVQTKRNLKKEKENCNAVTALLADCEQLEELSWKLSPEECLLLLEQLQALPGTHTVEWPEGEQLRVARPALSPADFHLSVGDLSGWFEISGDVQIDGRRKIKMAQLVENINQARGNFIALGEGDYVRITGQLRKYIDSLSRVATTSKGKLRLSPFNVFMLEELEQSGVQLQADEAYRQLISRITEAGNAEVKVPRNINADLRDYQKDGYRWMARLAAWGAGALLADDMGLGKTLQTITLLLSRAKEGPQLVIVPTSLIINWREETARFAPALNVLLLNRQGEDRKALIDGAKAYDIVIATYGLLNTEEELLTSRTWNTIVLDEAHTIKNRETKMSKAAMKLQSDCRVLLTGTPLQNHLSEIWNLMQFANPSLLGTYQEFTDRFIVPIERDHDKERQLLLRRIISPFLLRRTKSEVLDELPEKTEITLKVDLSADEWAFYDNIRQQALAAMENSENNAMQALAEITRLRQAACDVRLVEKKLSVASSKQEAFMQLVDDLHDNHHRALVFSQFTSHLALIRQRLDKEGIEYLYLDGSTTAKERLRLVDEFQHGDMPLFLISLKAGGLGLNLTAADYIIHLDPWWNPAIEDQASDRAYRIGQQNPVTVYRIIAAGTIEEKILSLHQTKKNLADALLEGSDVSAAMTREEMLALLRENM